MSLFFATCNVKNALDFLMKSFPEQIRSREDAPNFFNAVEKDYFRVCDPNYHQKGMIIGGDKYESAPKEELEVAQKEIQELLK